MNALIQGCQTWRHRLSMASGSPLSSPCDNGTVPALPYSSAETLGGRARRRPQKARMTKMGQGCCWDAKRVQLSPRLLIQQCQFCQWVTLQSTSQQMSCKVTPPQKWYCWKGSQGDNWDFPNLENIIKVYIIYFLSFAADEFLSEKKMLISASPV